MSKHNEQTKRGPGLVAILRALTALSVGLLLGFLGSHLFGQRDWSSPLFLLLAPLLLGMVGTLAEGTYKKGPTKSGFGTGEVLWVGVWITVLAWKLFQPQTITNCDFPDGPCRSTTASFWDAYAGFGLVFFLVFLGWGYALVIISSNITRSVITFAKRIRNKPEAFL